MSIINERIKQARKMAGIGLGQCSRFIEYKISKDRLGALEKDAEPTESELILISDVYNVNMDWLTGGEGQEYVSIPKSIPDYMPEEDMAKLFEILRASKG